MTSSGWRGGLDLGQRFCGSWVGQGRLRPNFICGGSDDRRQERGRLHHDGQPRRLRQKVWPEPPDAADAGRPDHVESAACRRDRELRGDPGGAILAAARGADVKIVGCYWPHSTHAVFVRAGIAKAEDLAGKTFAISAPGGLSDLLARLFLESHHMAPSSVRLVVLGSDANRYKGLVAGEVAAAVVAGEFGAVAQANGLRMLEGVNEFAPNWPNICTITSGAVLAARRDDAMR